MVKKSKKQLEKEEDERVLEYFKFFVGLVIIGLIIIFIFPLPSISKVLDANYGRGNWEILSKDNLGTFSFGSVHRVVVTIRDGELSCNPVDFCDAIDACPEAECTLWTDFKRYDEEVLVFRDRLEIPTTLVDEILGQGGYWDCQKCTVDYDNYYGDRYYNATKECKYRDKYRREVIDVPLGQCMTNRFYEDDSIVDYNITFVDVFDGYITYKLEHTFVNPYYTGGYWSGRRGETLEKRLVCINNELCWEE